MEAEEEKDETTPRQNFAASQIVQNLMLGQFSHSFLFSVKSGCEHIPKDIAFHSEPDFWSPTALCESYVDVQWAAASVWGAMTGSRLDLPQEFYLRLLEKDMRDFAINCYATFSLPLSFQIPETVARRFLGSLKLFETFDGALFAALAPTVESVLGRISPQLLFEEFGIRLLGLMPHIGTKAVQFCPVATMERDGMGEFMTYMTSLQDAEVIKALQSVLCVQYEYPKASVMFDADNVLSLANTSLSKGKHFVDFLFSQVRLMMTRYLTMGSEKTLEQLLAGVTSFLGIAEDVLPFFMVTFHNLFGQLDAGFRAYVFGNERVEKFPMVKDLLERFDRDEELMRKLVSFAGEKLVIKDLMDVSIPKILEDCIHQQACVDLTKQKYFAVSDSDLARDRCVAQSYRVMRKILKSLNNQKEVDVAGLIHALFDENHVYSEDLAIELFSLLFLKDKNGFYVFSLDLAHVVLNAIVSHSDNQYVTAAARKVKYGLSMGVNDLSTVIRPDTVLFAEALDSKSFEVAQEFAVTNPKMNELLDAARAIDKYLSTGEAPKSSALVELMMSVLDQQLVEPDQISGVVAGLILEHKQDGNPLLICDSDRLNEVISKAQIPGFFTENHDGEFDFVPFFQAFLDYVRMYFTAMQENVVPSSVTPASFVQMIVNNANAESWKELEKSKLPIEMILQYSSALDIQTNLFNLIVQQSKPTAYAIFYQKILAGQCDKDEILEELEKARETHGIRRKLSIGQMELIGSSIKPTSIVSSEKPTQPIVEKYLGLKLEQYFGSDTHDDFDLLEMSDEHYEKVLADRLSEFDPDIMNDLYFLNPEVYEDILRRNLDTLSVKQLAMIWPYMGFDSIDVLLKHNIEHVKYPDVFTKLLDLEEFECYYHLMHEFDKTELGIETLRERLSKDDSIIEAIRCASPSLMIEVEFYLHKSFPYHIPEEQRVEQPDVDLSARYEKELSEATTMRALDTVIRGILKSSDAFDLKLVETVLDRSVDLISGVRFSDIDAEMRLSLDVCFLSNTLTAFRDRVINLDIHGVNIALFHKIGTIASFIRRFWFSRFGAEISLANFLNPETATDFAFLCLKYDSFQLMVEFIAIWGLEEPFYLTQRAIIPFRMSLFDEGVALVDPLVSAGKQQKSSFNDCIEEITSVLSTIEWYNIKFDGMNAVSGETSLYHRCKNVCESNYTVLVGSDQISALALSLKLLKKKGRLISFYSQVGSFPEAFDLLREVREENKRKEYFVQCIVAVALFYSNWNSLWRYYEQKEYKRMGDYLDHLFEILRRARMGKVMYDIQMRLHMYEEAIDSALFSMTNFITTWAKALKIVDAVQSALTNAMKEDGSGIVFKPRKYSMEQLLVLDSRILLQKRLIVYCQAHGVPYTKELDILNTNDYNEAVAVWMLEKMECTYVLDLVQYAPFDLSSACKCLVERLSKQNKLVEYVRALSDCDQAERSVISSTILEVVKGDRALLEQLIEQMQDMALQAKMWVKYDFLERAFDAASKACDSITMRRILQKAQETNDLSLVSKCEKQLRRLS